MRNSTQKQKSLKRPTSRNFGAKEYDTKLKNATEGVNIRIVQMKVRISELKDMNFEITQRITKNNLKPVKKTYVIYGITTTTTKKPHNYCRFRRRQRTEKHLKILAENFLKLRRDLVIQVTNANSSSPCYFSLNDLQDTLNCQKSKTNFKKQQEIKRL